MGNTTVLVAGGAGFLGSNLCKLLLDQNYEVICLDNFYTGKLCNVEKLTAHNKFKILKADICQPIDIEVDQIYNLACPASPPAYQSDPIYTTKVSVLGSLNLLELARRNKAKILLASTSEIYGDPTIHPQREQYRGNVNPIGPRACYDEGKRCAESLFFDFHREFKVPIKIARIFNTYGPNMDKDDGRVISNLINQTLNEQSQTIYGTGKQTRSFCYVDDLVHGLFKLMESESKITGPINLGNPDERTVLEIADLIRKLIGRDNKVVHLPLPKDDPHLRCPDITLARELLDWSPTTTLHDGLKKTIDFYRDQIE